jgi:hypothetical protein
MKKRLFLLAVGMGLTLAASSSAVPHYIICETCTTNNAIYPCVCASTSPHPGTITDCNAWPNVCGDGIGPFPP